LKRFDLVVFDLDGTLADTAPDIASALGATLGEIGVLPPPLEDVKALVGDGARELIKRALTRAPPGETPADEELNRLLSRFIAHYAAHLCEGSRLYPGIAEAIDAARRAGIELAVVTNKPGALARDLLTALGVTPAFLAVIGDGDGFPRKPDPASLRSIVARVGTTADRTAVIGDGLPDIRVARALGATAVAAGWGYVPADRLRAESPDFEAATPEEAMRLLAVK
jgi:phosphoglycolate phosphatase